MNKFDYLLTLNREYERYSKQEELDMLVHIRAHPEDRETRDALILCYMPLVFKLVGEAARKLDYVTGEELIADAVEGLIYAIDKFDFSRNFNLSTYVFLAVRHAISKSEFMRPGAIRIPRYAKFEKPTVVSIETPVSETQTISDTLQVFDPTEIEDLKSDLEAAMKTLTDDERNVVNAYFYHDASHEEIGRILGVSHTWGA